jgi:hypothetical protein
MCEVVLSAGPIYFRSCGIAGLVYPAAIDYLFDCFGVFVCLVSCLAASCQRGGLLWFRVCLPLSLHDIARTHARWS